MNSYYEGPYSKLLTLPHLTSLTPAYNLRGGMAELPDPRRTSKEVV
ncbi:MAG: hypothetical protein ACREUM_07985 [Nitrosospira sp.]